MATNLTPNMTPGEREARVRLSRTMQGLLATQSFFASLALHMPFIQDSSRVTLAADGKNIRYNPEWVRQAAADELRLAISRVVTACALKHHTRRGDRDYQKWQQASQMVTLPLMRDAGMTDEPGGVEMSVEKAYDTLPDNPPGEDESEGNNQAQDGGQAAAGTGDGDGDGDQQSSDPNGQGEVMDSPVGKKPGDGDGDAEGKGDAEGQGQGSGYTDIAAALQQEEQQWDEAMHQAVQLSQAQGNAPGRIKEMVQSAHASDVDWKTLLRRFMVAHAKKDYTWTRPNRRHIASGLYLPALHSEALPYIVFAVDTSNSMDKTALAQVWAEVRAAVGELNPEYVKVIQCDTNINSVDEYNGFDLPEQLEALGRGGTDFAPVFDYLDAEGQPPSFLIYLTDLECVSYGQYPPSYPVIWASTNRRGQVPDYPIPPFGEIVDIYAYASLGAAA